jgi:hypothetical protein
MMISKIADRHLSREACIYIRQSTMGQVRFNQESTERQYNLASKAQSLGWNSERIRILDRDLGQSGARTTHREDFKTLVRDVAMGQVGAIFSLEASRLARSNQDWHPLLELCAITGTLVIDEDGCYDPAEFNDGLVLGMKGTFAQAELHISVMAGPGTDRCRGCGCLRFETVRLRPRPTAKMRDRIAALQAQSTAAAQECQNKFPPGVQKIAMARAQCLNDAMAILRPIMPYPDLWDLFMASHVAIAEQYQNGKITFAQGNEMIAQKRAELTAEEQRRQLASRSVMAQENVAAANLQAAGPHSCIGGPNVVSCF